MIHAVGSKNILVVDGDFMERFRARKITHGEFVDMIICTLADWHENDRELEKAWLPCLKRGGQILFVEA